MAQKSYAMPTKSSKLRSKGIVEPPDFPRPHRERTVSERVNVLLSEKNPVPTAKPTEDLQSQIDALRSAFNTLADVVVEEMSKTRQEVLAEASIMIAQGRRKEDDMFIKTSEEEPQAKFTLDLSQSKTRLAELDAGAIRKEIDDLSRQLDAHKQDTQYCYHYITNQASMCTSQ